MKLWLSALILLLAFSSSFATHIAVLETGADPGVKDRVTLPDRQYLTNVLREQAVKELPASQNYTIMTRENINAMLPPGKAIEDCEGSCLAETGRNISADYICQARISSFGTKLTLSAELYETAGNKLIASFNGRGADVEELLELIKEKSPEFFRSVKDGFAAVAPVASAEADTAQPVVEEPVPEVAEEEPKPEETVPVEPVSAEPKVEKTDTVRTLAEKAYSELDGKESSAKVGESVPTNVEKKDSGIAGWVILGIGVATTVTGGVLAFVGDRKAKEVVEKGENEKSISVLKKNKKDAQSWQTLRNIGIGTAILGAVGIGVSFAF